MSTPEATRFLPTAGTCATCGDTLVAEGENGTLTHASEENCPTQAPTTLNLKVAALRRDYGWQPFTALFHLAKQNGHHFGLARLTRSSAGLGYMARCTVPTCGASVWELPDLQGGHGAGPVVACTGSEAGA